MASSYSIFKFLFNHLIFVTLLFSSSLSKKPVNQTQIRTINNMDASWLAGENPTDIPSTFHQLRVSKKKPLPILLPENLTSLPLFFDARNHWTHCEPVLSRIRQQGTCDSGWAVATASVLSDRICIETKGKIAVHLSAEDLMCCCRECLFSQKQPCRGGWPDGAMKFWIKRGIVSGGEVNTYEGCKPYSSDGFSGKNVNCVENCTNKYYSKKYSKDQRRGALMYRLGLHDDISIQSEIFLHGPVLTFVNLYEDIKHYKHGVYRHLTGKQQGVQVVKIIGWGVNDGLKFWLIAFSFGPNWGQNGLMKILRGENHCGIEESILAGRMSRILSPREELIDNKGDLFNISWPKYGFILVVLFHFNLYCF